MQSYATPRSSGFVTKGTLINAGTVEPAKVVCPGGGVAQMIVIRNRQAAGGVDLLVRIEDRRLDAVPATLVGRTDIFIVSPGQELGLPALTSQLLLQAADATTVIEANIAWLC